MNDMVLLDLRKDGVGHLLLNRPEASNAMSVVFLRELHDAVMRAHGDPALRVLVLSGAGKNFCTGGDVKDFASKGEALPDYLREATSWLQMVASGLMRLRAPVIAAVHGYAAGGGGFGLVCAADLVIAGRAAKFLPGATRAGMAPDAGVSVTLSRIVGIRTAMELVLTNPTLSVGGQPVDSATFYQFNPTFDELTYDTQMYNTLVSAGFPSSKRFLIDTSRAGWGPTHPTTITQASDVNTYVSDNKIDKRPFRGDWCNQNNAGIGARPTDQPLGSSSPILAYVWIKPPGESDGDYPSGTHTHGDPHCDPASTNTDGNGGTYSTGAIPGFDVTAGAFFTAEFQMLVRNAFPAM